MSRASDAVNANVDMPAGQEQVYILLDSPSKGWRLYRSPDGRHPVMIDGPAYRTPREALRARQCEMARKVEMSLGHAGA